MCEVTKGEHELRHFIQVGRLSSGFTGAGGGGASTWGGVNLEEAEGVFVPESIFSHLAFLRYTHPVFVIIFNHSPRIFSY